MQSNQPLHPHNSLMQSNQHLYPHNSAHPPANEGGSAYFSSAPPGSLFSRMILPPGVKPPRPFHGVEVHPSEACPKNFIIFDQTDHKSKIMYHPAIGSRLGYIGASPFQGNYEGNPAYREEREISSYAKEDSDDIDALLSLEEEETEESDDEEVSTARTDANHGSNSPDSCSNYMSHPKKCRVSSSKKPSACGGSSSSGSKRQKTRKMVKALRGIIPGAGRMNTVNVLDEAVRYLKSLKVEVQKLGIGNKKSYI